MDGIDSSLSNEFRKRIENDMKDGKLTITKLSDAIIRVNKFHRSELVTPLSSAQDPLTQQMVNLKARVAALKKHCSSC